MGETQRVADFMGRGRGRTRWLDHLNPPPPAPLRPDMARWQDRTLAAAWLGKTRLIDNMEISAAV